MTEVISIRGVPRALAMDAWWLDTAPPETGPGAASGGGDLGGGSVAARRQAGGGGRWLSLCLVAALSVWLLWDHALGVSLVMMAHLLFGLSCWRLAQTRVMLRAWRLLVFMSLPAVFYVQPLSVAFLAAGLVLSLLWVRHPDTRWTALLSGAVGFVLRLPRRWASQVTIARACAMTDAPTNQTPRTPQLKRFLSEWGLSLGGALVMGALVLQANPILSDLLTTGTDLEEIAAQILFGTGVAFMAAPVLIRDIPLDQVVLPHRQGALSSFGINARSVLRALVVFNLIIAMQTLTDLSIIAFGARLPDGMTLAEFAHRGAYPLLVAALLAGAFALAAYPHLRAHPLIRPLMLVYVGQNTVLCIAALLRLELYVQEFGLTYLRAYSLIWMGLVALGLCLMLWQLVAVRSRMWFALRVLALAGATLYGACFVNFAGVIAGHNLRADITDHTYMCALGEGALPAVLASGQGTIIGHDSGPRPRAVVVGGCHIEFPTIDSWQEWGFHKWRLTHILRRERI